jgi:hypothetical protein
MTGLLRRRYQALLLSLVLLIFVYPLLDSLFETPLVYDFMLTLVYLAALLLVSFRHKNLRPVTLLLGVPLLILAWIGILFPGFPKQLLAVSFHGSAVLFLGYAVAMILQSVYREERVSADNVYGAFCGYLLLGVAFGHLYSILESLTPGSFQGSQEFMTELQNQARHHFLLTYFSFMTLTTVGYGDAIPARAAARGLAVVEAVVGQFYLAVLISELIGKRVSQAVTVPRSDERT